jgi:hypothetical protein
MSKESLNSEYNHIVINIQLATVSKLFISPNVRLYVSHKTTIKY